MAEKLNLWQKINAVMKDVEYLSKDDKVSTGATGSYKAISEEKVTTVVGGALRKYGLVIIPVEQEHFRNDETVKDKYGNEKVNRLTTVNVKYRIINIDNPVEFEIIASSGTGVDTQDKGVGKAMTYAFKYALLRTFAIPTGEDPDKVSSEEWDSKLSDKKEDTKKSKSSSEEKISGDQQKRMFALANGNTELVKQVLLKHKCYKSADVKKSEYEAICEEIKGALK
jgi:hypothetical protein